MKDIYFGYTHDNNSNFDLCTTNTSLYHAMNNYVIFPMLYPPDLNCSTITIPLSSQDYPIKSKPDLNMTLSILSSGILNIYYTFAEDHPFSDKSFE